MPTKKNEHEDDLTRFSEIVVKITDGKNKTTEVIPFWKLVRREQEGSGLYVDRGEVISQFAKHDNKMDIMCAILSLPAIQPGNEK